MTVVPEGAGITTEPVGAGATCVVVEEITTGCGVALPTGRADGTWAQALLPRRLANPSANTCFRCIVSKSY
jgi:hypothetical protein